MPDPRRSRLGRDFAFYPENILALGDGAIGVNTAENCPATANLSVIDNHKAPERRNPIVVVDHQRTARLNREAAHFVALELFPLLFGRLKRGGIHHLIDRDDFAFYFLRRQTQIVEMPDPHWLAHNPEYVGMNAVRFDWCLALMR